MDGALNTVAAIRKAVLANGYQPVAVKTGEKVPAGTAWQMRRGLPPISDIALNTGIICEGLCPADIDVDDADAVEAIVKVFDEVAGHTPLVRGRPNSPRRLLLYRAPDGTRPKKRVIKLGSLGKVELLGLGQQFVAYGMHPSGVEFEWPEAGPDVVKRSDMLVLTPEHEAEIERRLRSTFDLIAEAPEPTPDPPQATPPPRPDNIGTRERAAFEAALEAEVRNVATAGEGQRNHTLNTAAFCLAQMVASGWGSRQEVETALTEAAFAVGLRQPEIGKTIRSGINSGMAKPRPPLSDREGYSDAGQGIEIRLTKVGGVTINAETGEIVEDDEPDDEAEEGDAPAIDEALTHVDGVLGQIVDWIADCSPSGNRLLALSAALPLMGTLLGRRMATPTGGGGGLELYVISLLPSGGGKSVPMAAISRLMEVAGLDNQHIAPPEFRSGAAFGDFLCRAPLSLSIVDEVADYLAVMLADKQQSHQVELEKLMKEQWGKGFASLRTAHSKTSGSGKIFAPCYSIYGATTPDAFFRTIKSRHITGGFANRLTVIDASQASRNDREPVASLRHPPDGLVDAVRALYSMGTTGRGNLSSFVDKNSAVDPEPVIVPWGSQDAHDRFLAFEAECRALVADLGELGKIYGRTAFMAIKIATIRACGRTSPVTLADMEWGIAIARQSADLFRHELANKMLDPLTAGELLQKIAQQFLKPTAKGEALMAKYGAMTLPRRFLWANLRHHTNRHPGEFDSALKAMESGGEIRLGRMTVAGAKDAPVVQYQRRRKAAP